MKKEQEITVFFFRKNSWPFSIDEKIEGATVHAINVPISRIFLKNNKKYYKMVCGHGDDIDLLIV